MVSRTPAPAGIIEAMARQNAVVVVLLVAALGAPALADGPRKAGHTVKEALKTGGYAARDGVLTFGRTTRDFFKGGPAAASKTWHANAAQTKANAKAGGRATKQAAHGG